MLRARNIEKSFAGLKVLQGVGIEVERGSITGLIGPNGAGKSTLFNCLSGFYPLDAGQVILDDRSVAGLASHQLARNGLVRTFQIPREFGNLTVLDNLMVPPLRQLGEQLINIWLRPGRIAQQEAELREQAESVLAFLNLRHLRDELARSLSGGQKKLLELGRAMMLEPQILLLDEPVAGVNPVLAQELASRIQALRNQGMTFLIIEHNMDVIMELSDRIYVLAEGRNLMHGTPAEVRADQRVLDAYLGVSEE